MINIVSELIAKRAQELTADQLMTVRLVLKQPGKNVKQGAPKGSAVITFRSLDGEATKGGIAVRITVKVPGQEDMVKTFGSPSASLSPNLQKLLTPLKILTFDGGTPWTVEQRPG